MKKPIYYSLFSAFLLWLAWPPMPYTAILLWFAWVPLLLSLEEIMRDNHAKKGKRVFWTSFLGCFIWNTASIYWVYNSVSSVMPAYAAIPISIIPFALAPLLMATVFWIYYQYRKKTTIFWSLGALIVFWLGYEWLHASWDLAFPWMSLGNGFASTHQLIQWYSLTGVFGGTLWIWMANAALFLLILSRKDKLKSRFRFGASFALVMIIGLPSALSLWIYARYEEKVNPSHVVVIQPNIDPYGKFNSIPPHQQLEVLLRLSEVASKVNTEFIIWPETAIADPYGYNEDSLRRYPTYHTIQSFLGAYRNASLVSGIESYRLFSEPQTRTAQPFGNSFYDRYNAAVLIENSPELQFYHKSKLVPGVEQMPFGAAMAFMKPLFKAFGGTTGGYGSQDSAQVFYAQSGIGVAPVICYESIWGDYVAQYVRQGAQFIAIVTNDGWWGDTSGKDQHLLYAKLRAIETRRWVARSANTGISGFINQKGDVIQQSTYMKEAAMSQDIHLNEDLTFYVKHAAKMPFILFLLLLMVLYGYIVATRAQWKNKKEAGLKNNLQ
jgi:apolipoprotein N-acyltransferase